MKKDHLLSPAARSTFSVSTHLVRKPTQEKIPLEKRLYSCVGIVGQYLAKTYLEVKGRPVYLLRDSGGGDGHEGAD